MSDRLKCFDSEEEHFLGGMPTAVFEWLGDGKTKKWVSGTIVFFFSHFSLAK